MARGMAAVVAAVVVAVVATAVVGGVVAALAGGVAAVIAGGVAIVLAEGVACISNRFQRNTNKTYIEKTFIGKTSTKDGDSLKNF